MVCPECGAEFVPGVIQCSDCRVELIDVRVQARGQSPALEPSPAVPAPGRDRSAPLQLVTVLASSDPGLMAFAKSLLQSADIPFTVEGEGIQDLFGVGRMGFNPVTGPAALRVAAGDAGDARAILDGLDEARDADTSDDQSGRHG